MAKTAAMLRKSEEYLQIKADLNKQLEFRKANTPTFVSQVDDYMSMWVTKELLIADIEARGVYVKYDNGGGQAGLKKNDSVLDNIKVNAQMLKLLDSLNITSSTIMVDDDDSL